MRALPPGVVPQEPGPGQESVWDYPRPPRLEVARRRVRVLVDGAVLADAPAGSGLAWRVLETSHPPTYYLAPAAVDGALLRPAEGESWCEWKGVAGYLDVLGPDGSLAAARAAWRYPRPTPSFADLAGAVSLYPGCAPGRVLCLLDEEEVRAQPGGFYGGWVSDDVVGPFKGGPGSRGW
ncbi:DUF427 domain-containing protein [Kineococcus gypseus]|uniref:DUF427 domain-containing protein n=1 Tax=Kineococcus gypseus TaxID=1637102 RepID=UPI003D7D40F5